MTKLVGTGGYAQAGKDAVIDILVEEQEFEKTYMSRPLETALLILNPWVDVNWTNWKDKTWHDVYQVLQRAAPRWILRYQELHALVGYETSKSNHDVRAYLQLLGTEVGRNMFHKDVWLNIGFAQVDKVLADGTSIGISGIRYHNELDAVHERGGLTVWVNRPGYGPVNDHTSDNTLGPDDFDVALENDGTLDDLRTKILDVVSEYDDIWRFNGGSLDRVIVEERKAA